MKIRSKKFWIITSVAILIVVVVVLNFTRNGNTGTSVQADIAYIDDISEIVNANGRIQPQTKVDITAEVSAEIINLYAVEGQQVSKGDNLMLLDTVQLQSDVSQARYSLDEISARKNAAKAQFEKDKLEYERQSSLFQKGLSSETVHINAKFSYENSKANLEAYSAQVKTAEARLNKAEDNLNKTLIRAPMDGIIIYLNAEIGEIAQAQTAFTQGRTLMTVADLSVYEVEVFIEETEIASLALGQSTEIRIDAFKDSVFRGTVSEIGNSASITGEGTENFSTTFKVKIRLDQTLATIRPGMTTTVDITTATEIDALLVPYASIVTREFDPDSLKADDTLAQNVSSGEVMAAEVDEESPTEDNSRKYRKKKKIKKDGVYIIEDGKAKFVEVLTGIADDRNIMALSGVNPGDTVISGSFKTLRSLKEGDAVTVDEYSKERMDEVAD